MGMIQKDLQDQPLWISLDGSNDDVGREVVNVIVGHLDQNCFHHPFLVKCDFVITTDSATMARLVNDTLRMLNANFNANNAKLLVTDSAEYVRKCGRDLKVFYPSLLHITCLAHLLHRICDRIKDFYTDVNSIISSVRKVFLKAPTRRAEYKKCYPNLAFPPEPIVTR